MTKSNENTILRKLAMYVATRGGSTNFRRGFPLVVDPGCGGLGAQPPDADKV